MRSQFYTKYLSQEKMWSAPEQVRSWMTLALMALMALMALAVVGCS